MTRSQSKNVPFALETLEKPASAQLRALVQQQFGTDPGPKASRAFMLGNLSWAAQARNQGESPDVLRQNLKGALDKSVSGIKQNRPAYRSGTRLVREWHGTVHEVTVIEGGYMWNGQTFRSLSKIATAITGVRWSGPRFFGLKGAGT